MGQVTNGLAKIEITEIGEDNWRVLGYTNIDSASVVEEDGTTTDFNVEEMDTPLLSRTTPGKTTLSYQIADPDHDTFVEVFGGTITGSGDTETWNSPNTTVYKEFSVKITPEVGNPHLFNRMVFKAKKNFSFGKNSITMIDITADMLTPEDGVTPAHQVLAPVSNSGGTGSKLSQTITFSALGTKSIATHSPITLAATASSGLAVSYYSTDLAKATINGNTLTLLTTGSVNIVAMQTGNSSYNAAPPIVNAMTITS